MSRYIVASSLALLAAFGLYLVAVKLSFRWLGNR